jgi:hypothetical protein
MFEGQLSQCEDMISRTLYSSPLQAATMFPEKSMGSMREIMSKAVVSCSSRKKGPVKASTPCHAAVKDPASRSLDFHRRSPMTVRMWTFHNGQNPKLLSQYNYNTSSKRAESIVNTRRDVVHRNMALLELTTTTRHCSSQLPKHSFEMDHRGRVYVIKLPQTRCMLLYEDASCVPGLGKRVREMSCGGFRNTFSSGIVPHDLSVMKVEQTA